MTFESDETIELILETELTFKGVRLCISRAHVPKIKDTKEEFIERVTKLFIGAIPTEATLDELERHFERFGHIKELNLPLASNNVNKGYGFVTYKQTKSAKKAFKNFKEHYIRAKWVR